MWPCQRRTDVTEAMVLPQRSAQVEWSEKSESELSHIASKTFKVSCIACLKPTSAYTAAMIVTAVFLLVCGLYFLAGFVSADKLPSFLNKMHDGIDQFSGWVYCPHLITIATAVSGSIFLWGLINLIKAYLSTTPPQKVSLTGPPQVT